MLYKIDTMPIRKTAKDSTSASYKLPNFNLSKNYIPILVILLIVASFFLGALTTKVSYLEKNGGSNASANQPSNAQDQAQAPQPGEKVDVAIGSYPLLGNKDAKVTVIEFSDFQCPFCEKWYTEVGKNLKKDYIDTGKVKFAYRNYAFLGQESTWAAEAASCANEQGKFWEYHDYLFDHQGGENVGAFSKDNLKKFASEVGLNTDQFNSCLDTDKYAKQVADDTEAGQKAGVNGTPATFVNGQILVGAVPYDQLKTLIDKELATQ